MLILVAIASTPFEAQALAKTRTTYGYSKNGFIQMKIKNETTKELACWIGINGFKRKFRLPAIAESQWVTANDKRFNYKNFSTWCDFIELHPEYKKYSQG